MLDRKIQPEISKIESIDFLEPQHFTISDEVKLHWINAIDDESVKIDFFFNAGTKNDKVYIPGFVSGLLLSGTDKKSTDEINAQIDGLGGFFQAEASREYAVASIYGLRKNINAILQIVIDAITFANFPQEEIDQRINNKKQGFKVSSEKVSFLARRAFGKALFEGTQYAEQTNLEDFDKINREDLIKFHKEYFLNGLEKVCVVANLQQEEIEQLIEQVKPWCTNKENKFETKTECKAQTIHIEKEGAIQSAIRVGRILFNRTHEDYLEFQVTNAILGGYFGSRLMSNIREDKGYTYGIGSGLAELSETGYFFISTEVGKDVCESALKEIKFEINKLQTELVSDEELELVRNYGIGQMLKSSDGPNAMLDRYLAIEKFGLDYSYYNKMMDVFNAITPEKVQEMAQKYLDWDKMLIVTAG